MGGEGCDAENGGNEFHAVKNITLEAARDSEDDGVVSKGGVAMDTVSIIADAFLAVALDGPGYVEAVGILAARVESAGVEGEGVAGAAEAVAFAESVADGDSFDAAAEAPGKAADLWDGAGEAAAIEVLIGDGEDGFAGTGAEGVDAVGVAGIEKIEALTSAVGLEFEITSRIEKMTGKIDRLLKLEKPVMLTLYLDEKARDLPIDGIGKIEDMLKKAVDKSNSRNY